MKKITAVFLSALMILASFCAVIPASAAPSGTAIKDAAGFAAMTANGTYYLDADITLTATYNTTFTGTLDGNGHTVTVSVPMFKQMNGTVKNLTVEGAITTTIAASAHVGAVATQSKGGTFTNVINKADITVTVGDHEGYIGGLVGRLNGASPAAKFIHCANYGDIRAEGGVGGIAGVSYCTGATFDGCINYGDITSTNGVSKAKAAGGIYGYNGTGAVVVNNCANFGDIQSSYRAGGIAGDARKSATITNCTNNGNISLTEVGGGYAAGGIVGGALDSATIVDLTIKKCVNNGDVTGFIAGNATAYAGGMVGYTAENYKSSTAGSKGVKTYITYCINNGNIKAGNHAGGMGGYAWAENKSTRAYTTVDSCINNGNVTGGAFASEFLAYTNNAPETTFMNSIATGKLFAVDVGKTTCLTLFGHSTADPTGYKISNLFLADSGTTKYLSATDNAKATIAIENAIGKDLSDSVKAITRGVLSEEFVASANTAIGSELFALENGKVKFKTLSVGAGSIAPSDLSVDHAAVSVLEGQSVTLKSFFDPLGTTSAVRWESDDETVATVQNGVITGVRPGQTTVKVSCGTLSDTCTVTVKERVPITGVNLDKTQLTVKVGFVATLAATVIPENTTDDTTVTWSSDNESVATVVGGVVTGVAEGTAKITAKCGEHTATCDVTVESAACQHKNTVTVGYHAPNHVKQWAGESGVTTCLDCGELISENVKLAPGAHKGGKTYAYDADAHWKTCTYKGCDAEVKNTRGAHTYNEAGVCSVCGYGAAGTLRGDLNADGLVDPEDALYLLKNTFFGSQYPISRYADFTADGKVDSDDAIYLLKHTFFGTQYPLN